MAMLPNVLLRGSGDCTVKLSSKVVALLAGVACCGTLVRADVHNEAGDAGTFPNTAQTITGSGPLTRINGSLNRAVGDVIDMLLITISDPASFSAATVRPSASFMDDTTLFLFRLDGTGIAKNDDIDEVNYLSLLPVGASQYADLSPGEYVLGIAPYGVLPSVVTNPTSTTQLVFPFQPYTGVTGTLNGLLPMLGYGEISGPGSTGDYAINLTGASMVTVPTPAAAVLLGLGSLSAGRRRRS